MLKITSIQSVLIILVAIGSIITSCSKDTDEDIPTNEVAPLFVNSIVSTEIDFIKTTDDDAFTNLTYIGLDDKEMPDRRTNELFDNNTFVFEASFTNGKIVEIWCHSSFPSQAAAEGYAMKVTERLGKLPTVMRDELAYVVVHTGDEGAFAEAQANFFVVYAENIDTRISNNDFEETVFHESVHASLDAVHLNNTGWLAAQEADRAFITEYAQELPEKEDLAKSALFVYTMIKHPGRLSADIEE